MTVAQACEVFEHFPRIASKLRTMRDVGLGYIKLGQPATTLSGGEAQRVKLSTELSKRATGRTVYILDEPTTGLSFEDAAALLKVLQRLVDAGNSVILIEHHLDLIKSADHLIDLGPKAGDEGGYVVAVGTPEEIAAVPDSFTGQYLSPILHKPQPAPSPRDSLPCHSRVVGNPSPDLNTPPPTPLDIDIYDVKLVCIANYILV